MYVDSKGKKIDVHTPEWLEELESEKAKEVVEKVVESKENKALSVNEIKQKIEDIDLSTASQDDIIEIGKIINEKHNIKSIIGEKEELKNVFSQYREIGGQIEKDTWAKGSSKVVKEQINNVLSYYPKQWAAIPKNSNRQLLVKKASDSRGFFASGATTLSGRYYDTKYENYKNGYLTIVTDGERKTTPFHEIGHMVEWNNEEVVRLEKEFVENRTKGESPSRLQDIFPGMDYGYDEVTLKDDFISPYIGKTYDNATEVLSMGLQGIFESKELFLKSYDYKTRKFEHKKITDDEDFMNLVLGFFVTI